MADFGRKNMKQRLKIVKTLYDDIRQDLNPKTTRLEYNKEAGGTLTIT